MPASAVVRALTLARTACGLDDFGIRLSELRSLSNLGALSLLARDEPTVGQALQVIIAYLALHNDALLITVTRSNDVAIVRCRLSVPDPAMQGTETAVGMLFRILRQLLGQDWRAECVHFTRPPPIDPSPFRKVFGTLQFGAEFDGIVMDAAILDRPNRMADETLRPFAMQLLRLPDPGDTRTMSHRVRHVVQTFVSSRRCTAAFVAQRLGMSRRTLSRLLLAEGTTFLALLDDVRREEAEHQLRIGRRKALEIGELLGFAGPSAFNVWFRRCYGMTPRAWQAWEKSQGGTEDNQTGRSTISVSCISPN